MRALTSAVLTDRPDTIAGVLDHGFELYARAFTRVVSFMLVSGIPNALLGIAFLKAQEMLHGGSFGAAAASFWWLLPAWVVFFLFSIACYGAAVYRQGLIARGFDQSWWQCLRQGIRDALPLAGQTLLLMLTMLAAVMLGFTWIGLAGAAGGAAMLSGFDHVLAPVLITLWGLLLVIPAVAMIGIAMVPMMLSPIALLLLRQSVLGSISTGYRLMGQHFWRSTLVLGVPSVLYGLLSVGVGMLSGIAATQEEWQGQSDLSLQIAVQLLGIPINALLFPLLSASAIAHFSDLLLRREGRDLQAQLARLKP